MSNASTTARRLPLLFQNPLFWYLGVCAFTGMYFFVEHEGFYFGDDYSYSLYAHQLLNGGFQFDDYSFCHRFMVFIPTAIFYWLWGMNVYTTTLWPLLCTLGTLSLLYFTFRKSHPTAVSWALILLGLYYFQLNTSNYLYPDNILLFFTTSCLLVLYKIRNPISSLKTEWYLGLVFAVLNLLAFLTKETIVYTVPFYIILFLYQVIRRQNTGFWLAAIISGAIFLTAYFLLYEIYSGDAWQRFYDIKATNTVETKQAYLNSRSETLLPRLTFGPLLFFINSGLAIPIAFTVLFALGNLRPKFFSMQSPLLFWQIAMISMLFPIWFGTATVDFYKPMPLVPRMFHPLLPTFCMVAGLTLEKVWGRKSTYLSLTLIFGVSIFLTDKNMMVMYLPLTLFFAVCYTWPRVVPHYIGLLVVSLVLSIRPLYFMLKPTVSYYFEQKQIVNQHLSHSKGKHVVLMDSTMLRRHPFFYGFEPLANYSFTSYAASDSALTAKPDTVFLLINNGVLEHPELMIPLREKDILPLFPTAKFLNQKGKVKLYYIPQER